MRIFRDIAEKVFPVLLILTLLSSGLLAAEKCKRQNAVFENGKSRLTLCVRF